MQEGAAANQNSEARVGLNRLSVSRSLISVSYTGVFFGWKTELRCWVFIFPYFLSVAFRRIWSIFHLFCLIRLHVNC